jgi:four helix bundle protein
MTQLKSYRNLLVWQKSIDLVEQTYKLTKHFPSEEKFGLTSQANRASTSIPANIAEGYGRHHRGDYLRFLSIARGSIAELETHMIVAVRLGFVSKELTEPAWRLAQEVGKMLAGLVNSLDPRP